MRLNLTLKKKWFDRIADGRKIVEYRESKPYWDARLRDKDGKIKRNIDEIKFTNGYSKKSPTIIVECKGIDFAHFVNHIGSNGEELNGDFYIISIGRVGIISRQ